MTDHVEEAGRIARRFHQHHEFLWAHKKGKDPLPWEEMPESYRDRLQITIEQLLRDGSLHAGPMLGTGTCIKRPNQTDQPLAGGSS